MNKVETKEIPFYDDTLLGVRDGEGKVWLGVRNTCVQLGLSVDQAKRQTKNIQNDTVFEGDWKYLRVKLDSQVRKLIVISEESVPLWLAKIRITPAMKKENPEIAKKLVQYQKEAKQVLHKAFYETEEQKESLHGSLGLESRFAHVEEKLVDVTDQLSTQTNKLDQVMDYMTINTTQQGRLLTHAKDRVRSLLGGTRSEEYKKNSRKYFSNLWVNFKDTFVCASYKDLNPKHFDEALKFVDGWDYIEK